jgi:hypothetical protein
MHWLFLVPLSSGLISAYIAQKSADEIAYLTGAFTILSLFLTLVMAPWQIQILILLVAVIAVRQLWLKLNANFQLEVKSDEIVAANTVDSKTTRKYRGVSYEPSAHQKETIEAKSAPLIQSPKTVLKYRGASIPSLEESEIKKSD